MGAITTVATVLGGWAAGAGATIIAEGVTMKVGYSVARTKLGRFCVDMCAITLGGVAFDKVNDMFTDQAIEIIETIDKIRGKIKVTKDGETVVDLENKPKSEAEKEVIKDLRPEED